MFNNRVLVLKCNIAMIHQAKLLINSDFLTARFLLV